MLPIFLAPLLSQGLSLISNAVLAKGKEWVEDKVGVKLDQPLSQEDVTKLREFELTHEEELIKLRIEDKKLDIEELKLLGDSISNDNNNVSERWRADMSSDSTLSKNIRPLTLIYILSAYLLFALLSAANINIEPNYVNLLGQWGMLVMTAYFGGRTIEKVMETRSKGESK
jgi:hypothetical protein